MSSQKKYRRITQLDAIGRNETFRAAGCHSWTLINSGNTNATVGGSFVIPPTGSFSSPEENPAVLDYSELEIVFDNANDPVTKHYDTGPNPGSFIYTPGVDPVPEKANKIVVLRSFLSEI